MDFIFRVHEDWRSDSAKLYLWGYQGEKSYCLKFCEDGLLKQIPKEEGEEGEPFLILTKFLKGNFLQALVEGLKDAGYVAEVDNKQRIVAEALSVERKEELEIMRNKLFEVIDKSI